jgi:hypothetical protein
VLICPHLRLKKENVLTADDNGLTLIHADEEKRDMNNSDILSVFRNGLIAHQAHSSI